MKFLASLLLLIPWVYASTGETDKTGKTDYTEMSDSEDSKRESCMPNCLRPAPVICPFPALQHVVNGHCECIDQTKVVVPSGCDYCPKGQERIIPTRLLGLLNPGPPECAQCSIGTFKNGKKGKCVLCPLGYFTTTTGNVKCRPCLVGTKKTIDVESRAFCGCDVENGFEKSFNPDTGKCACAAGKKQYYRWDTSLASVGWKCDECPAGYYNNFESHDRCTACPRNYFNHQTGQKSCQKCGDNTDGSDKGSDKCFCKRGSHELC